MVAEQLYNLVKRTVSRLAVYAKCYPTSLSLQKLVDFGSTAPASKSFDFLKHELLVRVANTFQEFQFLPESLLKTNSLLCLARAFEETFDTLLKYEKCDSSRPSVISDFTDDLSILYDRHSNVVPEVAAGIAQTMSDSGFSLAEERQLQYFLDRFYVNRIGIRTLISQHILLYGPVLHENASYVGCIDPQCDPLRIAVSAYTYARTMCRRAYGRAPGCTIRLVNCISRTPVRLRSGDTQTGVAYQGQPTDSHQWLYQNDDCGDLKICGDSLTFCYIPGHLFHMLFELMKNAMRAVVESGADDCELPKLSLVICHAPEDVTFKLTDTSVGMTRKVVKEAFKYTFSTASRFPVSTDSSSQHSSHHHKLDPGSRKAPLDGDPERATSYPLAGLGHGLPLSRLYARYLGGDLRLISVEGRGSSAFVYLKRLPEAANELLPIFSHTARSVYRQDDLDYDWISGVDLRDGHLPLHPNIDLIN